MSRRYQTASDKAGSREFDSRMGLVVDVERGIARTGKPINIRPIRELAAPLVNSDASRSSWRWRSAVSITYTSAALPATAYGRQNTGRGSEYSMKGTGNMCHANYFG